jgi:hypothetical protein
VTGTVPIFCAAGTAHKLKTVDEPGSNFEQYYGLRIGHVSSPASTRTKARKAMLAALDL